MKYWLMKSEPATYSIDDLKRDKVTYWDGVRNFQARNFMRDEMKKGDLVLFYHSNAEPSGVAGIAKVVKEGYPDHTSWDKQDDHYDPRSTPANPLWFMVDLGYVRTFSRFVPLDELKRLKELRGMLVVRQGVRLSVQPVEKEHFNYIQNIGLR